MTNSERARAFAVMHGYEPEHETEADRTGIRALTALLDEVAAEAKAEEREACAAHIECNERWGVVSHNQTTLLVGAFERRVMANDIHRGEHVKGGGK